MIPYFLVLATTIFSILSMLGILGLSTALIVRNSRAPHLSDSLKNMKHKMELKPDPLPKLSIIVTAKNEEGAIGKTLDSLLLQTYSNLEILVVDDSSADRTPEIVRTFEAKNPNVHLEEAGDKPEGWVGKSWPCWKGYERSTGKFLLFLDADSIFAPETVEKCVSYVRSEGIDIFSMSPNVELRGVWAHATMPFLSGLINLLYPMRKVNDPKSTRAYVFGAFILVRKEAYESIGGHEAVKGRIVEDAALAENAKKAGYKLRVETGKELFTTEWEYRLRRLYQGLERVMSHSIRNYGYLSLIDAFLLFMVVLYPLIFAISSALSISLISGFSAMTMLAIEVGFFSSLVAIIAMLVTISAELKLVANKISWYPLLYPVGCVIFILAIISTTFKMKRGQGIEWKGQAYSQKIAQEQPSAPAS